MLLATGAAFRPTPANRTWGACRRGVRDPYRRLALLEAISLRNDLQLLVTARGIDKAFLHMLRMKANGDEEDVVAYQAKVTVLTAENVPTA
jgi:hypothetical protein